MKPRISISTQRHRDTEFLSFSVSLCLCVVFNMMDAADNQAKFNFQSSIFNFQSSIGRRPLKHHLRPYGDNHIPHYLAQENAQRRDKEVRPHQAEGDADGGADDRHE